MEEQVLPRYTKSSMRKSSNPISASAICMRTRTVGMMQNVCRNVGTERHFKNPEGQIFQ